MSYELKTKDLFSPPNLISIGRIFLVFPFIYLIWNINEIENARLIIFILAIIGYLSDIADGYLARKMNLISEMGKLIDPLADKICIGAIIIGLYLNNEINSFYFIIVILRDILIFIGGIILSKKIGKILPSNILGKVAVLSIGIYILFVVAGLDKDSLFYLSVYYISIFLIIISFFGYLIRAKENWEWKKNGTL